MDAAYHKRLKFQALGDKARTISKKLPCDFFKEVIKKIAAAK